MGWGRCWGCDCKLGWGYNESMNRLVPVEGEPLNATSESLINHFLEPSCKKFLDFGIIFDDEEYWELHCWFYKRRERSEKFLQYPFNCSHYVRKIDYGVNLSVQFLKEGFPEKEEEIVALFKERTFDEAQKKIRCRALINYDEVKEMNLGEVMKFMEELDGKKHSKYIIPIGFVYEKLAQETRSTVISNEDDFGIFLSCLYCAYRKIEIKMEKVGYPSILPDTDPGGKSLVTICANLDRAKEEYKNMDKNNFLKMYPVLKRLFLCYTDYIRYSMDHVDEIDEGNHLPGSIDKLERRLESLNKWFPIKIKKKWFSCMGSCVILPSGCESIVEALRQTVKFDDSQVINDDEVDEPYILDENNKRIPFGFVNMEGAELNPTAGNPNLFESECPEECNERLRRWICVRCGEFVQSKLNSTGQQVLYCTCGSKKYKDRILCCSHIKRQTSNPDEVLTLICQQLQKSQSKNEGNANTKIQTVISHISKNKNEEEIKSALKDLHNSVSDKQTQHLINQYLNRSH